MSIAWADTATNRPPARRAASAWSLDLLLLFRTLFPRLVVMPGLWGPSITVRLHRPACVRPTASCDRFRYVIEPPFGESRLDRADDSLGIEPAFADQDRGIAMIDKAIRHAKVQHRDRDSCVSQGFRHGAAG